MPSPIDEFDPQAAPSHSVGVPPDFDSLRARARQIRQAQASNRPIPEMGSEQPELLVALPPPIQRESAPQAAQRGNVNMTQQSDTSDTELDQVRTKMKLASYYESLLETPAFGDDIYTDPFAATVQSELTEWVKGRMSELVGIRNNPEGFLDGEVQLLKTLAQSLGVNGVKALVLLADRMVNPPIAPVPTRTPTQGAVVIQRPTVVEDSVDSYEDFEPGGAMVLEAPPPVVQPEPPPVPTPAPVRTKRPYVRRAKIPGAVEAKHATNPSAVDKPPQQPAKKGPSDPLAAGKALVASMGQPAGSGPVAPVQAPAMVLSVPVPMPRGSQYRMVMEQKAAEADSTRKLIAVSGLGGLV